MAIALVVGLSFVNIPTPNVNVAAPIGAVPGTDHYQKETFFDTLTAGCAKIYQLGATTNASSTFYLVASTTITGGSSTLPVFATSTKPANCP